MTYKTVNLNRKVKYCQKDLKAGRYRQFIVLIITSVCEYLRSSLYFMLTNMALAKGHSSKTKSQVSGIRTIGPLVFLSFLFVCLFVCLFAY